MKNSIVKNLPTHAGNSRDTGLILESEMSTHSNLLAWKIPRTEEHGGLQSMGLKRVGHG